MHRVFRPFDQLEVIELIRYVGVRICTDDAIVVAEDASLWEDVHPCEHWRIRCIFLRMFFAVF